LEAQRTQDLRQLCSIFNMNFKNPVSPFNSKPIFAMRMHKTLLILLFIGFLLPLSAQRGLVKEVDRSMSFGTRPCFRIELEETSTGLVVEEWKKFAKDRFGAKLKKDGKSGEYYAEKLTGSIISTEFAIRSTVEEMGKTTVALNVWFDLGTSYLDRRTQPEAADEAVSALTDAYIELRKAIISKELKEAEGKMKELESSRRKMEKENLNLHKDIENYKEKIKKAEEDIVRNEQEQNVNAADQEKMRAVIEEIQKRLQNVHSERNN